MAATVAMSAPPAYLPEAAPAYHYAGPQSTPAYSDTPYASERVLDSATTSSGVSERTITRTDTLDNNDFVYHSDHMDVNLGSRIWGLRMPAYGREGHVEGFVKFSGEESHVTSVQVKLHGDISIRTSHYGQVSGAESTRFLRQTITVYSTSRPTPVAFNGEHHFSFALPSHVDLKGKRILMPATFVSLLPSTFCEVSFVLKVDMVRKGFLRRHETIRIPISYFPKTRPSHPSVMEVPWPLASPNENPFDDDTTVKCTALQEYDPITRATITRKSTESIYLAIPEPTSFTSGEDIPFILSFKFPRAPTVPQLLTPNIRIEVIKRTRISRLGGVEVAVREISLGAADIRNIKEEAEGIAHLSGVVRAGQPGRENSWAVNGMADVQYVIRCVVQPPKTMLCHMSSWRTDIPVQLTTDLWGTLESELIATGGVPTPALAMASSAQRACAAAAAGML